MNPFTIVDTDILIDAALQIREAIECLDEIERRSTLAMNPQKYRYVKLFDDLAEDNTHIIAIVLFRFSEGPSGEPVPNNYIVTASQKEIG